MISIFLDSKFLNFVVAFDWLLSQRLLTSNWLLTFGTLCSVVVTDEALGVLCGFTLFWKGGLFY